MTPPNKINRLSEIRKDQPRYQRKIRNVNEKTAFDAESQKTVMSLKEENFMLPVEPPFVKLYTDNLSALFKLTGGENGVLYCLVRRVDFDGFININLALKKRIAREIGTENVGVIANAITTLKKLDIIRATGERSEYMLNPKLFAKGDWKAIEQMRKLFDGITLTMSVTQSGVEYSSEMIPKEKPCGDPDLDQIDMMTGKTKRELLAETA